MVVALAALVLSVGGNVTAAVLITSADIKDNTIRSADVRDGTIRSADVKNDSLTGVDVGNNSLTGTDLNESTLARVPAAASAINAQSAANAGRLDGKPATAYVADTDSAGGDATGTFSNVQIGPDTIGRAELGIDHNSLGCCVGSFFEFTVPANTCHIRASSFPEAHLGEILIPYPESADLGPGVYMRPTMVAHPGEIVIETCNSTGADVVIPLGTFFRFKLIE
jgi:hypothetical protein